MVFDSAAVAWLVDPAMAAALIVFMSAAVSAALCAAVSADVCVEVINTNWFADIAAISLAVRVVV